MEGLWLFGIYLIILIYKPLMKQLPINASRIKNLSETFSNYSCLTNDILVQEYFFETKS